VQTCALPIFLVAEGTARGTLLLAEPGGLESLVPGAEADRGGLVAGDVVLAGPGGEGLAGGLPGLGVEGAEVGDDLLLGAASSLPGHLEGGLVAGAPTAQQPAHLLLGQAERRPRRGEP